MRRAGRRLPWQEINNLPALTGFLRMFQVANRTLGTVTVLELRDSGNQTDTGRLATLFEPVLVNVGDNRMVFRGFERQVSEDGPVGLVQEWRCELIEKAMSSDSPALS